MFFVNFIQYIFISINKNFIENCKKQGIWNKRNFLKEPEISKQLSFYCLKHNLQWEFLYSYDRHNQKHISIQINNQKSKIFRTTPFKSHKKAFEHFNKYKNEILNDKTNKY